MFLKSHPAGSVYSENYTKYLVNLCNHNELLNFSEDFLLDGSDSDKIVNIGLPYPIHKPLKSVLEDVVQQLVKEKKEFSETWTKGKKKWSSKDIEKLEVKESYMYLPKGMLDLYDTKDPDKHFSCDYNYYYTGGFLEQIHLDDVAYLVRPDCDNNLCLSDLQDTKNVVATLPFKADTPIHNLHFAEDDSESFLTVVEKHRVSVLVLINTNQVLLRWQDDFKNPILDAKLNANDTLHLGILDTTLKLRVKQTYSNTTVFNYKASEDDTNFMRFEFFEGDSIVIMDRFKVRVINYRTSEELRVYDPDLTDCNSLCNFKIVGDSLLLASRHYLLRDDIRNPDGFKHFSHSLLKPPLLMDAITKNGRTYVCLASDSEKVLFTEKNGLFSMPYKVPSLKATLKEAYLRNESLVLIPGLDEAMNYSNAGLKILNVANDRYIYFANSLGGIFRQKISHEFCDLEEPVKSLLSWIDELKQPESNLHVTNLADMSNARFALNTQPCLENLKRYDNPITAMDKWLGNYSYRYSKANVTSALAKDFLSIWEDEEEENKNEGTDLPEVPAHEKVTSWLNMM